MNETIFAMLYVVLCHYPEGINKLIDGLKYEMLFEGSKYFQKRLLYQD